MTIGILEETKDQITTLISLLYKDEVLAYGQIVELTKQLQLVMNQFLDEIPKYNAMGADIQIEIVLQQLRNMVEAIEYKDTVLLVDTLRYEIMETIMIYGEILGQVGDSE